MVEAIRRAIDEAPEVRRIIHVRTLHLGPDEVLVAAKLDIDAPDVGALARAIDAVEVRIRAAVPIARVIYIEPDCYRTSSPGPETPSAWFEVDQGDGVGAPVEHDAHGKVEPQD
jgi:divalent metal cation (Fe/Co/Zn/Cd) transporter